MTLDTQTVPAFSCTVHIVIAASDVRDESEAADALHELLQDADFLLDWEYGSAGPTLLHPRAMDFPVDLTTYREGAVFWHPLPLDDER